MKTYFDYQMEHSGDYEAIRIAREADVSIRVVRLIENGFLRIAKFPAYFINEYGEVYSTHNRRVIKVRPGVKPGGYEFVGLRSRKGGALYKMVHRLVAEAFIPNPENLPQINHKDGNKRNNRIENLEWVTPSGNIKHAFKIGLFKSGSEHHNSVLTQAQVREIRAASGRYRDIGRRHGVCAQTVCNVKRRSKYGDVA